MVRDLISYAAAYVSWSEYSDETKICEDKNFSEKDSVDADLACGKILSSSSDEAKSLNG